MNAHPRTSQLPRNRVGLTDGADVIGLTDGADVVGESVGILDVGVDVGFTVGPLVVGTTVGGGEGAVVGEQVIGQQVYLHTSWTMS